MAFDNAGDFEGMRDAISQVGLIPPEQILFDEKIHRFPTNGDRSDKAGYYCAFNNDGFQSGFYGCWRTGIYQIWTSKNELELTPEQRQAYREKIQAERLRAEALRQSEAKQAAVKALEIWNHARPATDAHLYLKKKAVKSYGMRVDADGRLIIPVMTAIGEIMSLQFINPDGTKKFLPGGTVKGGFYRIPGTGGTAYLCEGYATASTIHQATGEIVFVGFFAGNLKPVAEAIRKQWPDAKLIICADNDQFTPGNPGFTKGREAAAAVGAGIVWPEFTNQELLNGKLSDFNDLAALRGLDAAKERLKQTGTTAPDELSIQDVVRAAFEGQNGAAGLFTRLYKNTFLYDHATGLWYDWHENFWKLEACGEPTKAVDSVADLFKKARAHCAGEHALLSGQLMTTTGGDAEIKKIKQKLDAITHREKACAARLGTLSGLIYRRQVVEFAAQGAAQSLGISGDQWDADGWLLACPNGVINLHTGELRPGRQSDYIKTVCPTIRDPSATCPNFLQTLDATFNGDQILIDYIQRVFGMALVGEVIEHRLFIFYGPGRNGKDTLLEIVFFVLGGDLAGPIQAELLLDQKRARSSAAPSADIMALRGRRLTWCSETNEGRRLDAGRVKLLTGGGALVGRPPFGKREIVFKQSHTIILMTNSKPHANPDDFALWKRIDLIPFEIAFVDEPKAANERKADKHLLQKLKGEAPGILNWLIDGCLEWQRLGLDAPDKVKTATTEYQTAEDLLLQFFDNRCLIGPNCWTLAADIYKAFKDWCADNGLDAMTGNSFGRKMGDRFERSIRRDGTGHQKKAYEGIALVESVTDY